MDDGISVDEIDTPKPSQWKCCTENIPTTQIVFFVQVILVYIVTITCIVNLALGNEPKDLWVSLLASCLGYILPAPALPV